MKYIIGLLGFSKAGKDEVALSFLNDGFKRYAFGDEVKEELAAKLEIPVEDLHNHNKEKYREQMITYGEGMRKENPDYWIDRLKDKIYTDYIYGQNIIITDIRRVSEIKFFDSLRTNINSEVGKVLLIHVDRPEADLDEDMASHYAINYAKRYNKIDLVIENKYDKEILYAISNYILKNKIYVK